MAEGRCAQCARYFLIIFNFIFWIFGGAILGVGIYLLVSNEVESRLSQLIQMNVPTEIIWSAAIIMIAIGAFVFFVGFCGCCGAMRESAIMLGIYIACMVVVLLAEVSAGIYVAVEKGNIESTIRDDLGTTIRNYTGATNSTIDFLQIKFKCCGSTNFTDYQNSVWFNTQLARQGSELNVIPKTCCSGREENKQFKPDDYRTCNWEAQALSQSLDTFHELHPQGCSNSLMEWLDGYKLVLIGVVLGIAVIEVFGIAFAGWLCRNRTEYYD